jgi:hypothetical protein
VHKNYRGAVFLVPEYPWPRTSGGRVRAGNISITLAGLGPATVLAPDMPDADPRWLAAGQRHRARRASPPLRVIDIAASLVRGRHVVAERAERSGTVQAFEELLKDSRPSVVILGRPFLGPYVEAARRAGASVIAEVDESLERVVRSTLRSNIAVSRKGRVVFDLLSAGRMERAYLPRVDQIWVSSEIEAQNLRWISRGVEVRVIPSGVSSWPNQTPAPGPVKAVGFVGYFTHPPNEAAALELIARIMPAIRAAGGPRRLVLIGSQRPRRHDHRCS